MFLLALIYIKGTPYFYCLFLGTAWRLQFAIGIFHAILAKR